MSSFWLYRNEEDKEPKEVKIDEQNVEQTFFNYQKLKKIVLKQLGYLGSNKNNIQLSFIGIYPQLPNLKTPIINDQNLIFLLAQTLKHSQQTKILFTPLKQLKQKGDVRKRPKQIPVQFDSDGSVQSFDQDNFANILPSGGRYLGDQTVRCQFCKKNSKDMNSVKKLGPFYGPFGANYFVHLICAIWCSPVFIQPESNLLTGVQDALKQYGSNECKVCGKLGALQCHSRQKCLYKCHYECGVNDNVEFNWGLHKYNFLCKKCKLDPKKRKGLKWFDQQVMSIQQV